MKKNKKIFIVLGIVICMLVAGAVWWFLPYYHAVRGTDKHAGYEYYIVEDVIYLSKYVGKDTIVHVPEKLKGRKVIMDSCCFERTGVEEVYVPSVVEIPEKAFSFCRSLQKVQGSSNRIIYKNTFLGNENLEEVFFYNEIEKIEDSAFRGCKKLENIDFIKDVKCIESAAFMQTAVDELIEMNKLIYVGSDVFEYTPWEEKQQGDFVILNNTLQLYKGSEQTVHIPNGITAIYAAFYFTEEEKYPIQVKEIYIPDSVQVLAANAFLGQEDLTVYIPNSVTKIGNEYGEETYYDIEDNVKIVTTSGSYAEEYAQKYGIEYEIVDGWDLTESETESLNEKDKPVSDSYAVEGDAFSPFMYDIDEDGKEDKIEILCEVSNNYAIDSLTLQVGDLKKSIEINTGDISEDLIYDDLKCYVLHVGEKRNLIYIHTSYALDDLYFGVICEVTESEINVLNDKAGIEIDDQSLVDLQKVVCRNESLLLDRIGYFYILSYWQFDEAGQISKKEGTEYFLSEGFKVETIADLTVDEVGEDGAVVESQVVLPVGTILVPLCTDDETYVDFTDEEGKIYRVSFEVGMDDGGRTGFIQGTAVSEWLEVVV